MFYFRLALSLGMTVRELLSSIDSRELSEWIALYGLEPFGDVRKDLQTSLLATVMANAWCGSKDKTFTMNDFMLFGKEKKSDVLTGPVAAQVVRQILPKRKRK